MKGFSIFLFPMEEYDSFGEKIGLNFARRFTSDGSISNASIRGTDPIGTGSFPMRKGKEHG
jgi:hypothetical protein